MPRGAADMILSLIRTQTFAILCYVPVFKCIYDSGEDFAVSGEDTMVESHEATIFASNNRYKSEYTYVDGLDRQHDLGQRNGPHL